MILGPNDPRAVRGLPRYSNDPTEVEHALDCEVARLVESLDNLYRAMTDPACSIFAAAVEVEHAAAAVERASGGIR